MDSNNIYSFEWHVMLIDWVESVKNLEKEISYRKIFRIEGWWFFRGKSPLWGVLGSNLEFQIGIPVFYYRFVFYSNKYKRFLRTSFHESSQMALWSSFNFSLELIVQYIFCHWSLENVEIICLGSKYFPLINKDTSIERIFGLK